MTSSSRSSRRPRSTGWRSSGRSARRSRHGDRRSSSRTWCDKRLRPEDLPASRVDVFSGALLTNVIAFFIVVACAATLYATGQTTITDAAQAAKALEPLAGATASVLFAVGLLGAAFLGLGVVPLTSAYSTCETFGWETGRRLELA